MSCGKREPGYLCAKTLEIFVRVSLPSHGVLVALVVLTCAVKAGIPWRHFSCIYYLDTVFKFARVTVS